MTVFRKLQAARYELVQSGIKKTGHNKFGGWHYYELGDFIPTVHRIFDAVGLCGVVNFGEVATLTVYDTEDGTSIQFSTPIVYAENNKGQAIQVLGSTHTYLRRYLWLLAMEIVENDAVDAEEQTEKKAVAAKPAAKLAAKPEAAPTGTAPAKMAGREGEWQLKIEADPSLELAKWIQLLLDAVEIMLSTAKTKDDVMNIFKNNRNIFDKLKVESEADHKAIMDKFAAAKKSFE